MAARYELPDFTQDTATEYKTKIDQNIEGLVGSGAQFAAQQTDPPSMGILINAGIKPLSFGPSYSIAKLGDIYVAAHPISGLGTPAAGQKQLHVISYSWETFTYVRHYSAAVADTTPDTELLWPTGVPAGNMQICALILKGGQTQILDADILDLRATFASFPVHPDGAGGAIVMDDKNGQARIIVKAFGDLIEFHSVANGKVGYLDGDGNLHIKGTVQQIP